MEAANRGDDLPDSFPLDPEAFEYLLQKPPALAALQAKLQGPNCQLGFGAYRGYFNDSDAQRLVLTADTDGDVGFLVVCDAGGQVLACARHDVERLSWMTLEQLGREARRY